MSRDKDGSTPIQSAEYKWLLRLGHARLHHSVILSEGNSVYMKRWIAEWGEKGPTIRLHVICRTDNDRCVHDHPWSFWSFVIWGGYTEEVERDPLLNNGNGFTQTGPVRFTRRVWPLTFNHRNINFRHRIIKIHGRSAITLVFSSRQRREWGFYTDEGFVPWTKFLQAGRAARALWCRP